MKTDDSTTVRELRELVRQFVEARDWRQFHAPKNLSMALAVEAAELMEHFQWLTVEASRDVSGDSDRLAAIQDELADVLCYALAMANELGVDVSQALRHKMVLNEQKYPVDEIRGRYGHDDPARPSS